jgi:adenylate cyclase
MAEGLPADKLAVILHADVAGSTRLVQLDEHLAHDRIRQAFRNFGEVIERYQGTLLEVRGDALLAEFQRPSDAVAAALAFQSTHGDYLGQLDGEIHPYIRIGIAIGEVVIADGTATGAGVVMAQRVEQLSDSDGLCITSAIHESLPRRMPFEYESLGECDLKGFEDRVKVFRVRLASGQPIPAPHQEKSFRKAGFSWKPIVAIVAVLLVVSGGMIYTLQYSDQRSMDTVLSDQQANSAGKPSVAVLPFVNMSGDPEQEYFSDGMTEDLLTDLSQISALTVISRTSSFAYKGQSVDVREVGKSLGASHVVEGSVRKAGDRIRISAQLIDTASGEHLWAERYDRQLDDIFQLQDEVRAQIVAALEVELAAGEATQITRHGTNSSEAYDLFMQGRYRESAFTRNGTEAAIALYERALEIDPGYAVAYARLANMYDQRSRFDWSADPAGDVALALQLVDKSLSLNESDPYAHWSKGRILSRIRAGGIKNQFEAVASLERAIELNPNYADPYAYISYLYAGVGDLDKGREAIEKAMQLNPEAPFWYLRNRGIISYLNEDYEAAIANFEAATQRNPASYYSRWWLAAAYALSGDPDEGKWQIEELAEMGFDLTIGEILEVSLIFHAPFEKRLVDGLRMVGIPK